MVKGTGKVYFFKGYFKSFFDQLDKRSREKVLWTLRLISELEQVPSQYLKQLKGYDALLEIRVRVGSNSFRMFCFYNELGELIVCNGFQKKSNKTPRREIQKALRIRQDYYEGEE